MHRRTVLTAGILFPTLYSLASSAALAADLPQLAFPEMYSGVSVLGLTFSDKLKSLAGKRVRMQGFMAPPLKADAHFFVLTESPVSLCPFCSTDADWPDNIVVVFLSDKQEFVQANSLIEVVCTLEVGSRMYEETGFVSLVRIVNARFEVV